MKFFDRFFYFTIVQWESMTSFHSVARWIFPRHAWCNFSEWITTVLQDFVMNKPFENSEKQSSRPLSICTSKMLLIIPCKKGRAKPVPLEANTHSHTRGPLIYAVFKISHKDRGLASWTFQFVIKLWEEKKYFQFQLKMYLINFTSKLTTQSST